MKLIRTIIVTVLMGVCMTPRADCADWDFRDLYMSVGLNSVSHDIRFPREVREYLIAIKRESLANYTHSEIKPSLLLDIRMDLRFQELYRLVPVVHFWNWGDFPESDTGTETSIRGFGINVEVHRMLTRGTGIRPYAGGGLALMVLRSLSRFDPSFWASAPQADIARMEQQIVAVGGATAFGLEFPLKNGSNLFTEIRYEIASNVQQMKFLVGISTF